MSWWWCDRFNFFQKMPILRGMIDTTFDESENTLDMTRFIVKTLSTSVAVLFAAYVLKGVHVADVPTAILVAVVLGLLNSFIRPILVLLTIPITVVTLGLFLIAINYFIVHMTTRLVPGFQVDGWFPALLFSLLVSVVSSIIEAIAGSPEKSN
jgi:putative membrane protein